ARGADQCLAQVAVVVGRLAPRLAPLVRGLARLAFPHAASMAVSRGVGKVGVRCGLSENAMLSHPHCRWEPYAPHSTPVTTAPSPPTPRRTFGPWRSWPPPAPDG